ncbi:uncharacterized protein LOC141854422 isoform X2 [Brevipalpus obovatus]|uniref:uncharacterized protein LOC141854422 isoform X2 n=1 Tax=Brevipalpus obovatus TaxID=246614 RepID=UPI003D9F43C1
MGLQDSKSEEDIIGEDDDLTSLTWLQDRNLLKSISTNKVVREEKLSARFEESEENEENEEEEEEEEDEDFENVYPSMDDDASSLSGENQGDSINNFSIPSVSYNPQVHVHGKPPYSFSSLIFMAIESSPKKALPVKEIYAWITENFPYFQSSPNGWKNTVRHNLSLNKCFKKLDRTNNDYIVGKGSLWCVDPELKPNLLQAVRRTPANNYSYMSTKCSLTSDNLEDKPSNSLDQSRIKRISLPQLNASHLIGKRLLIPIMNRESEEAAVAESMLTLTRYNTDDSSNVIIIDGKSEIIENEVDVRPTPEVKVVSSDVPSAGDPNPIGDHNYFTRSRNSIEIVRSQKNNSSSSEKSLAKSENGEGEMIKMITIVSGGKRTEGTLMIKRKKSDEDDDGLKGAQALLHLASRAPESSPKPFIISAATVASGAVPKRPRRAQH